MAEATGSMAFSELYGLLVTRFSAGTTAAKATVNLAYMRFLRSYDWSFLKPVATLELWYSIAADEDNTVTSSGEGGTTLTAESAIFHSTMVGATITIAEVDYTITAYTSSTVVTISAAPSASGATFTMTPDGTYPLPDDFQEIEEPFSYAASSGYRFLNERTTKQILDMRADSDQSGYPDYYAIEPKAFVAATGQRWQVRVYPTPSNDVTLTYRYKVIAADMTSDGEYPRGGGYHALTIGYMALADEELTQGRVAGPYQVIAKDMLDEDIRLEKERLSGVVRPPVSPQSTETILTVRNLPASD